MIAITPSIPSVRAAFFACGCLKAETPFEMASTPVSALDPDANARSRAKSVIAPVPTDAAHYSVYNTSRSGLALPNNGTLLYSLEIPSYGGDTQFTNLAAAYNALSAPMRLSCGILTVALRT